MLRSTFRTLSTPLRTLSTLPPPYPNTTTIPDGASSSPSLPRSSPLPANKAHLVYPERTTGAGATAGREQDEQTHLASGETEHVFPPPLARAEATPLPAVVSTDDFGGATTMSTLSNGIRVITRNANSATPSACFGLYVDVGTRDEREGEMGAVHALERAAWAGSNVRDHASLVLQAEEDSVVLGAQGGRDVLAYTFEGLKGDGVEERYVGLLGECVGRDGIPRGGERDHWWGEIKAYMGLDAEAKSVEFDGLAREVAQEVAFGGTGLGAPAYTPQDVIGNLDLEMVEGFRSTHLVGEKMVLAGVGMSHVELVSMVADSAFADVPKTAAEAGGEVNYARAGANYTGGLRVDTADIRAHPYQHTNVVLGFEGAGWNDPDMVHLAVLHMLLGGGSAFSAGGPGKGMYTRLYQTMLARYHWLNSANAMNTVHADSGLFTIHVNGPHEAVGDMILAIVREGAEFGAQGVPDPESVGRAKAMLKSMVSMNLEHRGILVEDMGRQVLLGNEYRTAADLHSRIDAVTGHDLIAAWRKMFASTPTLWVGGVKECVGVVPQYQDLVSALSNVSSSWQ